MSVERTSPAHPTRDTVEIRRNGALAALLGAVSLGVAILYLSRAVGSGAVVDWLLFAGLAALGVGWFVASLDARTPLLVADAHGVRVRLGRSWRGLPWAVIDHVEHQPRSLLRDGRLAVVPTRVGLLLEDLDSWGVRRAGLNRRLHGAPAAFSLGLATRVHGCAAADLPAALDSLARGGLDIVEVSEPSAAVPLEPVARSAGALDWDLDPGPDPVPAGLVVDADHPAGRRPRPLVAHPLVAGSVARATALTGHARTSTARTISWIAARFQREDEDVVEASPTPEAARESRGAARSDVTIAMALAPETDVIPVSPLAGPADTGVWAIEDQVTEVVTTVPVIGPVFADARRILGLSVDQVSERTRIRPHVIEAIEADDFAACGGDFYARGHLRTLARILGVDAEPLLATYDEKYAHAPIDPRQVFEAELAGHAGGIRGTRGGPNWSVLVAAVMAVVLSWSIARLITEAPGAHQPAVVRLSSDGKPAKVTQAPAIPIAVAAVKGGAHVTIVDGAGEKVWEGDLAVGQRKALSVSTPIHVSASDGGAVTVNLQGRDKGTLGPLGRPGTGTFIAPTPR